MVPRTITIEEKKLFAFVVEINKKRCVSVE